MSYYISPRFLDKLAVHLAKNFMKLPNVNVPLILGIHGGKGEGKSFQCELAFERLGIEPIRMSGGELESPDAGDPARLIRMRYREASELVKVRGKMCALLINDLDAGGGTG
jgi:ATPase family associated with various cellular activities (AAA)